MKGGGAVALPPDFFRNAIAIASIDTLTNVRPTGFKNNLALQLGIASASLTAQLQKQLAAHRLTPREAILLWLIDTVPGAAQAEIAVGLDVPVLKTQQRLPETGTGVCANRPDLRAVPASDR